MNIFIRFIILHLSVFLLIFSVFRCLCFDCHEARSLVENEINQHLTTLSTPDLVKFMNVVVGATFAIGIDDVVEAVNKTMWHTDEVAR